MPILNWLNKDEAIATSKKCTYRLLEEVPELSYGDIDNENLLIQGDNLEALKALIPHYAGKVKCIFIDPPYNTKSAFEHYDDNIEHSKWLSLMYPRLELLRELLTEKGSIWITLDDNESHYFKVICDEIFGRKNFVGNIVWEKVYTPKNNGRAVSSDHDHVLVYAKSESWFKDGWNLVPRSDEQKGRFKNPDHDPKGPWRTYPLDVRTEDGARREKYRYEVTLPSGRKVKPALGRHWALPLESFQKAVEDGEIYFGKKGDAMPTKKAYLSEAKKGVIARSWWTYKEVSGNQDAKREILALFGDSGFITPKPEKLIERVLTIATNEHDLVLDSFLGSGTTAAVSHKMKRKYIGIEIGDHAKTHCQKRLKQVVDGEQGGISVTNNWQGGGGFRFYKLGEAVFDEYGCLNTDIKFPTLASHIWYLETKTPLGNTMDSPLLGVHNDTAYYLLYNGILGDRRPAGGNVLTSKVLNNLPDIDKHDRIVIYGESSRLGEARLKQANITFKQIPYDVGTL
ncbi:site-specific DNA-methyltransferase [Vibrio aquimaris]|uniref:Modification methylase MboII n=1 Tax=Vibrio aquimaris TaxID=2587862 RepID=A0A5P9CI74_9VIBR|nr:site-specific DNA-methyltransferase [Vibrio aquimaris]QFT25232.1 Modification methylase MboII [Vibrio aquimaris]